jgi:hypothetical protein
VIDESMDLREMQRRYHNHMECARVMASSALAEGHRREAQRFKAQIDLLLDPAIIEFDRLFDEYVKVSRKLIAAL